jgi:hypothetical protein
MENKALIEGELAGNSIFPLVRTRSNLMHDSPEDPFASFLSSTEGNDEPSSSKSQCSKISEEIDAFFQVFVLYKCIICIFNIYSLLFQNVTLTHLIIGGQMSIFQTLKALFRNICVVLPQR